MKIIILTSSEIRHKSFRLYLNSYHNIKILRTYSEQGLILEDKIKKKIAEGKNTSLELDHLFLRKKAEHNFFNSYISNSKDNSKNKNCEKGYISTSICLKEIKDLSPDLIVVYGSSLLKGEILNQYKNKIINVHLGLSPYYRGSGTNYFPFVNNEPEYAGATFMYLNEEVDMGQIIHQIRSRIFPDDNFHQIGNRLIKDMFQVYAQIILNIKKIKKINLNYNNNKKLLYKIKDFTPESLKKLYYNFNNEIINNYLKNKKERDKKVPLTKQDWIKEINYNHT